MRSSALTDDMRWVKVPATGDVPGGRASHASAAFRDHVYIFGGLGPGGALDTTYRYHTGTQPALGGTVVGAALPRGLAPAGQHPRAGVTPR